MKKFWKENNLSIVIFSIFAATIVGMSIVGWQSANGDLADHNRPTQSYPAYLTSGDFIEGVFENWESEFLQMWALVVLTIWLRQKGADESKPLRGKIPQETASRYSILRAATFGKKVTAAKHHLYSHSLSLTLLLIFFLSFAGHAVGGSDAYNQEQAEHGEQTVTPLEYVGTSQFWYESLQNWQSEFFAVGTLMLLSIKLRERGSPESKPVGKAHDHSTGS